jgi:Holliday junction DNA helicase RuvA
MYDFLRGQVAAIDAAGRLSLDVNGVGYSLRISDATRRGIALDGSTVTLHVRLLVKEDDLVLFGFADVAERAAFDLLVSVQQVGPAVAMAVLSQLGVVGLRHALLARDAQALRAVKGVGPKTAERMVLELADKVERIPAPATAVAAAPGSPPSGAQAVEEAQRALVVLGFGAREAAEALAAVAAPGLGSEHLLRAALARLR